MTRFAHILFALGLAAVMMTGCFGGSSDTPKSVSDAKEPAPAAPPSSQHEGVGTPAKQEMQEEVQIRLVSEPRLTSPITTLVSSHAQQYEIRFKEPMNRRSVEQTIRAQVQVQNRTFLEPKLTFEWSGDDRLTVTADTADSRKSPDSVPGYPYRGEYRIHVAGALTASGRSLDDTPSFHAVVQSEGRLWKLKTEGPGSKPEPLAALEEPYELEPLSGNDSYMLAIRFTHYCECDAEYERLYGVYDLTAKRLVKYPVKLQRVYRGSGDFVADTRGFFYENPGKLPIPQESAPFERNIRVEGYVHGAAWSKDGHYVLMAVGAENQTNDFDFVIYDIRTGTAEKSARALFGDAPENELSGAKVPVHFYDSGEYVYTALKRKDPSGSIPYRFAWKTKKLEPWDAPVSTGDIGLFSASDDGVFTLYPNAGLYRQGKKLTGSSLFHWGGFWLPNKHAYVYLEDRPQSGTAQGRKVQAVIYDADRLRSQPLAAKLPSDARLVGSDKGGTTLYLWSYEDIPR